ncbi:hypothetical protein ACMFMG_006886 [Clarireedia jacksonii]
MFKYLKVEIRVFSMISTSVLRTVTSRASHPCTVSISTALFLAIYSILGHRQYPSLLRRGGSGELSMNLEKNNVTGMVETRPARPRTQFHRRSFQMLDANRLDRVRDEVWTAQ